MAKIKRLKIHEMEKILSEYSVFRSYIETQNYNDEYFGNAEILLKAAAQELDSDEFPEVYVMKARMFAIRRFILSLGAENERLFLFYHYIHGLSVGRIADLMGFARSSAFRLKIRSLEYAAARYYLYLGQSNTNVK